MDEPTPSPAANPADAPQLADLSARVAELERLVALLQSAPEQTRTAQTQRASSRAPFTPPAPPPPPPPPVPLQMADEVSPPPLLDTSLDDVPMLSAAPSPFAAFKPAPEMNAPPPGPGKSLETRLGATVFNLVGILALLCATAYGLKLAIEHGYFNPLARVLLGLVVGVAVVLWSERFRRKGMAPFSYSLKAVGSAVLYLSLWASFHIYHQMPASVALVAMILVTAWNAFMAWSQDAELLAAYALLGGFLTPLLLSSGGNHETFLFTYIAALDLGVAVLLRSKPWRLLLLGAFPATVVFFMGWYSDFFGRTPGHSDAGLTIFFIALLFAIFAVISLKGWAQEGLDGAPDELGPPTPTSADLTAIPSSGAELVRNASDVIIPVLLPLANAVFLALSLYSVFQDSGLHDSLAFLMVGLAALYLGLMRLQRTAVSSAMHLAVAVIFLTVAIPLKASGHTLTTAWLVEGLVLFWASTRFGPTQEKAARVLQVLSAGGYVLGLGSLVAHWFLAPLVFGSGEAQPFLNRNLAAALVAVATLGGAIYVALRDRTSGRDPVPIVWGALAAIDAVAMLLTLEQIEATFDSGYRFATFFNAPFGTALVALAVLLGAAWLCLQLLREPGKRFDGGGIMLAITFVLIDLLGFLFTAREWAGASDSGFSAARLLTALLGLAVLALVTRDVRALLRKDRETFAPCAFLVGGTLLAIDVAAVLLTWREILSDHGPDAHITAFLNADFAIALLGLAVLAGTLYTVRRYPDFVPEGHTGQPSGTLLAAGSLVAFNLLAILSVEHEIGALWHRTDANLQRSLAISGFLMAYGAALLAAGFWKRVAFVRWQALALLAFTICKVFLYDIGSLSAGYRVASLFGLGAVLMAVSYAYQKDWLGLKDTVAPDQEKAGPA